MSELHPDDTHAFLIGELIPAAKLDRGRDVLLLRAGKPLRVVPGIGNGASGIGNVNGNGNGNAGPAAATAPANVPVTATPRTPTGMVSNAAADPARPATGAASSAASAAGATSRALPAPTQAAPGAQPAGAPASNRPASMPPFSCVERIQHPESRCPPGFTAERAGGSECGIENGKQPRLTAAEHRS